MSETKQQAETQITAEQLEKVGGGSVCSVNEMFVLVDGLTRAYEGLIDFTSHVFERVVNGVNN